MGCTQEKVVTIDEAKAKRIYTKENQYKLYAGIFSGNRESVKEMIEKGFLINYRMPHFNQRTPMHVAADVGSNEIVDFLISKNAEINIEDENGLTPIFLALKHGHKKCVLLLLESGADVSIVTKYGTKLKEYIPKGQERKYLEFIRIFKKDI